KKTAKAESKSAPQMLYQTADPKQNATTTPPVIAASEVIKAWKQVQNSLKKDFPTLAALLNSVTSIDVQGNTLVLGFASEVLMSKMKPEEVERTRKAVTDALGVTLDIRCEVSNAKGKVPPHVSQDGMVATAIHQGGEIVDVQE
ncbi:MAG: hypothetical protein COS37_07945, partial [Anaerolineae bacterium CG03_land_8_20_14_0_80_58_20]